MFLPRPAARDRGDESQGGRSGLVYYLPCVPPNGSKMMPSGHEAFPRKWPRANRFCSETASAGGPNLNGFSGEFIARGRTTLSLRPFGRTVGGNTPAARGSTGCTLN